MRVQCPDGDWFDGDLCPRCEWPAPDPEPPPPRVRESFDRQVAAPDRDALRVMADELGPVHADGFAAARKALAEAEWKKRHAKEATK